MYVHAERIQPSHYTSVINAYKHKFTIENFKEPQFIVLNTNVIEVLISFYSTIVSIPKYEKGTFRLFGLRVIETYDLKEDEFIIC